MTLRRSAKHQRGLALLVFVIALAAAAGTIVLGYSMLEARDAVNRYDTRRAEFGQEVRARIASAYEEFKAEVDTPPLSGESAWGRPDHWLQVARITPSYDMRLFVSDSLVQGNLRFRRIVAYFPAPDDTGPDPEFDAASGVFELCPGGGCASMRTSVTFEGREVQARAMAETLRAMTQVALKAEAWFQARVLEDPDRDLSLNHFGGGGDCDSVGAHRTIPCYAFEEVEDALVRNEDMAQSLTASGQAFVGLVGVDGTQRRSAWGSAFYVANTSASSDEWHSVPPFRLKILAYTPWGERLTVEAVQPI